MKSKSSRSCPALLRESGEWNSWRSKYKVRVWKLALNFNIGMRTNPCLIGVALSQGPKYLQVSWQCMVYLFISFDRNILNFLCFSAQPVFHFTREEFFFFLLHNPHMPGDTSGQRNPRMRRQGPTTTPHCLEMPSGWRQFAAIPPHTHPGGRLMLSTLGPGGHLEVSVTPGKNSMRWVDFCI